MIRHRFVASLVVAGMSLFTQVMASNGSGLPDHVNNGISKFFRPIYSQGGYNSCGSSASIGYMFTYEWNAWNLSDASLPQNQFAAMLQYDHAGMGREAEGEYVGFTNAKLYGGNYVSSIYGGYEANTDNAGWIQGYESFFDGMRHRLTSRHYAVIPNIDKGSKTALGSTAMKQWLYNHCGDSAWPVVTDENGTHVVGGVLYTGCGISQSKQGRIPDTETNRKIGVAGKVFMQRWNTGGADHALMIVGYDDRIQFDMDGNGIAGETSNHFGDNENGAWIIANSWGSGWANGGFIYVPYCLGAGTGNREEKWLTAKGDSVVGYSSAAGNTGWTPSAYELRGGYEPNRTMKVTMSYDHRSEISVSVGVSQDTTATQPEYQCVFPYINYCGDGKNDGIEAAMPLLGRWADGKIHDEPMEYGVDLTDLTDKVDVTRPLRYFLIIHSKDKAQGQGKVLQASVMDYRLDKEAVEYPFGDKDVSIRNAGATTMISTVVPGLDLKAPLNVTATADGLTWTASPQTALKPMAYRVLRDGKTFATTRDTYYNIGATATDTSRYAVKAVYLVGRDSLLSPASSYVGFQTMDAQQAYARKTLNFTQGAFTIPHVCDEKHDSYTIEYWLKASKVADWTESIGHDWRGGFLWQVNNGGSMTAGWSTSRNNQMVTDPGLIKAGVWTHLALVINGSSMTLYVNGEKVKAFTATENSGMPANANGLRFGVAETDDRRPLFGHIAEVRVWSTARTARQIKDNMYRAVAHPQTVDGLLAYLTMDTVTVNGVKKIKDWAHGHDASLVNDRYVADTFGTDLVLLSSDSVCVAMPDSVVAGALLSPDVVSLDVADARWTTGQSRSVTTSALKPSLVMTQPGRQTVSLAATLLDGRTINHDYEVVVTDAPAPTADFTFTQDSVKGTTRVSFLSRNKAEGCAYSWTVEGAVKTSATTHDMATAFTHTGVFPVTLVVTTPDGRRLQQKKHVTVLASAPVAGYSIDPTDRYIIKGQTVTLKDNSLYSPTAWTWDLMSGNCALRGIDSTWTVAPPRAGVYTLYQRVSNSVGDDLKQTDRALIVCNAPSYTGLAFDGTAKRTLTTPPLPGIGREWTLDYWLDPNDMSGTGNAMYGLDADGKVRLTLYANSKGTLTVKTDSGEVCSPEAFYVANEWHHYAVTCSNKLLTFYRDGQPLGTATLAPADYSSLFRSLQVGGAIPMDGCIDELRVWKKQLTQEQIKAVSTQPITGDALTTARDTNGLIAYYNFNGQENNGYAVADSSGLGHDAVRSSDFGPMGDSWKASKGVFALDFDSAVSNDVTTGATLLSNAYTQVVGVSDEETKREYCPVDYAFDNDDNTLWHTSYYKGEVSYPHSVTVTRTDEAAITGMALYTVASRARKYHPLCVTVEQSDDQINWETVDKAHHLLYTPRPTLRFERPATKRYVRITFTASAEGNTLMTVNDIKFYGSSTMPANRAKVALGYVSCSDEETKDEKSPGNNAVDGDTTTLWHSHYNGTATPYPHSITLSNTHDDAIRYIGLFLRDMANYAVADMKVYVADSANGAFTLADSVRIPYQPHPLVRLNKTITSPYVRLVFTHTRNNSKTFLAIHEITAYGDSWPLSVSSAGHATWYHSHAVKVPDGVEASSVTVNDDGALDTPYEYGTGTVIPAYTPVLFRGAEGNYPLDYTVEKGTAPRNNNLRGTLTDLVTIACTKCYRLSLNSNNDQGSVGFYFAAKQGESFVNKAHKAYLAVFKSSAARSFFGLGGAATAIGAIIVDDDAAQMPSADSKVYNLQGQYVGKLGDRLPVGVYICNGKKIIINNR